MKVLVACEESQEVCKAFRALGHEAYSCDLQACSGGHPEWHIMHDALEIAYLEIWDLMVAHPPCTYLTNAGIGYFNEKVYGDKARERKEKRKDAAQFFMKLMDAPIDRIAVENPVGWMNSVYRKPNQVIHPWFFGDSHMKRTYLWLRRLPRLNGDPKNKQPKPLSIQTRRPGKHYEGGETKFRYFVDVKSSQSSKERSNTFPGIARAMAQQWGGNVLCP